MRALWAAIFLSLSMSAFAEKQKLLEVVNDMDQDITTVSVISKAGVISGINMISSSGGQIILNETYTLTQARQGIVMFKAGNHEVIRLTLSDRFEPQYGGPVILDHLYNGITGSRKNLDLDVVLQGESWVLEHQGKNASRASVITNRVLGKVIGVKQIRF